MIREIGVRARPEIEALLGRKIFLELVVKVRPKWRRDDAPLERLGLLVSSLRRRRARWRQVEPPVEVLGREDELRAVRAFLEGPADRGPGHGARARRRGGDRQVDALAVGASRPLAPVGFRVLSSRPGELDRGVAYAALGDLLEDAFAEVSSELPGAPSAGARGRACSCATRRTSRWTSGRSPSRCATPSRRSPNAGLCSSRSTTSSGWTRRLRTHSPSP